MISLLLVLSVISPTGGAGPMEVFGGGDIYLVTFGKSSGEVCRDSVTGIRFESLGCVVREGDLEAQQEWNDFMLDLWSYLGSDSTFFVLRTETESLEYRGKVCLYRDRWGSVPMDLYPEELASIVSMSCMDTEEGSEARLTIYTPLRTDTISVAVQADSAVLQMLLQRGREQIRLN